MVFFTYAISSLLIGTLIYKISPAQSNFKIIKTVKSYLVQNPALNSVCDLGSGFGFFCLYLSWCFPQRQIQAIEIQTIPYYFSIFLKYLFRRKNLHIRKANFFHLKTIDVDCVYCYLYNDKKNLIGDHLKQVVKRKTVVISSTFKLNLGNEKKIQVKDLYFSPVYFYEIQPI